MINRLDYKWGEPGSQLGSSLLLSQSPSLRLTILPHKVVVRIQWWERPYILLWAPWRRDGEVWNKKNVLTKFKKNVYQWSKACCFIKGVTGFN